MSSQVLVLENVNSMLQVTSEDPIFKLLPSWAREKSRLNIVQRAIRDRVLVASMHLFKFRYTF